MCFTIQRYNVPSCQIGDRFFDTLALELNIIQYKGWNAEIVSIFQTVILQHVCLVSSARNIRDRITERLNLWNKGAYNELVQDSYGSAADF